MSESNRHQNIELQSMHRRAPQPEPSPLWPQYLVDLFVRPRKFFSDQLALGKTPYAVLVTWCYGIASAIERVDQELLKTELGRPRPGWDFFAENVIHSWIGYWGFALVFGALSGVFLWYLGGWWYRVRLRWSGAVDPNPKLSRLLYVYAAFVGAGPLIVLALIQTAVFQNYLEAFQSEELYSFVILIFPFWSLACSYIGIRTLFEVNKWKARLWFVIFPALLYVFAFGLIATLFVFLGSAG